MCCATGISFYRSGLPGRSCSRTLGAKVFHIDVAPGAAVALQQIIRLLRAPGAGRVVREATCGKRLPDVEQGLNDAPSGLDHVRTLKECGVADHTIVEQALVTCTVRCAEVARVVEIHVHQSEFHYRPGNFSPETERNAF